MSTVYTANIFCDRCGNWLQGVTGPKPQGLARKAVEKSKRNGWSRQNNSQYLDLCPVCLDEERKGK